MFIEASHGQCHLISNNIADIIEYCVASYYYIEKFKDLISTINSDKLYEFDNKIFFCFATIFLLNLGSHLLVNNCPKVDVYY